MCRVGDTYPSQMLNVQVSMWLYRFQPTISLEGERVPVQVRQAAELGRPKGKSHVHP